MKRSRVFPWVLGFCVYSVMVLLESRAFSASTPNFVFIMADDCTFRDLGCYGGQARTPHIDQLATEGMRFTRCFQAAPMCSPTRHNIYTGQYPVKTGAYPNHTQTYRNVKNVTQFLPELGYRVALSGKKHIGPKALFEFEYSGDKNNPDMKAIGQLFQECAATETPFALFACSNEPHTPWNKGDATQYPPERIKLPPYLTDTPEMRSGFSKYLAEITYFDQQVGEILSMLDRHGLSENSVVMVVSEQGNSLPFAKWTCYDSGLQSALIVRWTDHVQAGAITSAMVEYTDILPTMIEIAGGTASPAFDGKSFLPVLRGETDQHKDFVFGVMTTRGIINGTDCYPIRSIRSDQYKLILNLNSEATFTNACTQSTEFQSMIEAAEQGNRGAAELVARYQKRPAVEFYDVETDPFEMINLAENPSVQAEKARLLDKLSAWMSSQNDLGIETEFQANSHLKKQGKRLKK